MKIILRSDTLSRSDLAAGLSLTRAFFPQGQVEVEEEKELVKENEKEAESKVEGIILIDVYYPEHPWKIRGSFSLKSSMNCSNDNPKEYPELAEVSISLNEEKIKSMLAHPYVGRETKKRLLLKRGLIILLAQVTGHRPPWGTLTGIRPSKVLHRLTDEGYSAKERKGSLRDFYLIRDDKAQLLQEVVSIQDPFVKRMKSHPNLVAVYIGIPFCPTRCSYCSFPAYSLSKGREPLVEYLKGLGEEIRVTGEWMREEGLFADSIYIGGGTPTILNNSEISSLINVIGQNIPTINSPPAMSTTSTIEKYSQDYSQDYSQEYSHEYSKEYKKEYKQKYKQEYNQELEFTVEAGRPDTLTQEKLLLLRESGVNRISINPQTMHNHTLQRIGRAHTVEDILKVYDLAQKIPGWIINMDLIIGLPGENLADIQKTLKVVMEELEPDNLTTHTLAIKRGSKEHEKGLTQNLSRELEAMQEAVLNSARKMDMVPYYLYRQKHISGNLENIGFAKAGLECRYNIGIMEEYQTVLGLGAGASSKIVNPKDYSLVSLFHPYSWQVYLERWKEIQRKREKAHEELRVCNKHEEG